MPILSPSLEFILTTMKNQPSSENFIRFYHRYLRIASRNIKQNFETNLTSGQFKKDLSENISNFNDKLDCKLKDDDFINSKISNYYKYLYKKIAPNSKMYDKESKSVSGQYFKIIDNKIDFKFFSPNLFPIDNRYWIFTDTNVSILVLNNQIDSDDLPMIFLETDLMVAAGFTLVLCANCCVKSPNNIFALIRRNQFSEIHLNLISNFDEIKTFFKKSGESEHSHFLENEGFVYLYSTYFGINEKIQKEFDEIKEIERVSVFLFSNLLPFSIKSAKLSKIKPFAYYKHGFSHKRIRIFLSNVPLFEKKETIPSETSGLAIGYILPDDFLNWQDELIKVSFEDANINNSFIKYVSFDDIHKLNIGLFVEDQLSLAEVDRETFDKINVMYKNIQAIIKEKKSLFLRKTSIFSILMENVVKNSLEHVVYEHARTKFFLHKSQLYTAFEACIHLFSKNSKSMIKLQNQLQQINDLQLLHSGSFYDNNELTQSQDSVNVNPSGNQMIGKLTISQLLENPSKFLKEIINNNVSLMDMISPLEKEQFDEALKKKKEEIEEKINQNKDGHKGIVFQVETGEGKSCIIAVIAAVLALSGKRVHIASSNIKLANRDYVDSFDFFKSLKIKSAVFLQEEELPVSHKVSSSKDILNMYTTVKTVYKGDTDENNNINDTNKSNASNVQNKASKSKNINKNDTNKDDTIKDDTNNDQSKAKQNKIIDTNDTDKDNTNNNNTNKDNTNNDKTKATKNKNTDKNDTNKTKNKKGKNKNSKNKTGKKFGKNKASKNNDINNNNDNNNNNNDVNKANNNDIINIDENNTNSNNDTNKNSNSDTTAPDNKSSNNNDESNQVKSAQNVDRDQVNSDMNHRSIFNENMAKFYEIHEHEDAKDFSYYYSSDMYSPDSFKNSSGMNLGVCGLNIDNKVPPDPPKVIFSTFVNFECFYLKMMEICPGYVDQYYGNCVLLVDEADSILIDEIANGTIISREMKSNSKEILKFIYEQRMKKEDASKTWDAIKDNPKCCDLTLKDIERMYEEIDLVNKGDFEHGKRYLIKTNEVQNDKKKKKFIKQALNLGKNILIKVGKGLIKEFFSDNKEEEDEDEDEEDEDDDDEDENEDPVTVFREIIPYDYDHKGILEPKKEFGGFIQQFIAIKESKKPENQNMIIKDMSISYLYISHPIFVKLYSKVCGFTGTIGTEEDRQIFQENYDFVPVEIPRNKANLRVEFPMILCETIQERNEMIAQEVIFFHKHGNPVIVIFQDLKEIESVWNILSKHGIKGINIFDGTNAVVRPDKIAGKYGSVSLGTNVCGRGTDIKVGKKPLHVIIAYYTSNKRVMDQARGRTGRQGRKGTCRVICLEEQYFSSVSIDDNETEAVLEEFSAKNQMQSEFIQYYMKTRPWIFSNTISKQDFSNEQIEEMRAARINVNRCVAFNYEFPLKMKVKTFLHIQSQKIFSILNCPNSEFTWRLFQRYLREMLLQSWSLKLTRFDEDFFDRKENKEYKQMREELNQSRVTMSAEEYKNKVIELNERFSNNIKEYREELSKQPLILIKQLLEYLPKESYHIVPTFMHIFRKVAKNYQPKILRLFGNIPRCFYQNNSCGFASIQIGFKPYSLLTESGARINYKNFHKTNFIKDPELKYLKKTPKNRITWLSITEKIDDLFNWIFQEINKILGKKTFLKLFMRRTLFGCEFGICLDFPFNNEGIIEDEDGNPDIHCLVDKDPLLIFTISVKSIIPILAGILIIVLVYAASMSGKISQWLVAFPEKLTEEVAKRGAAVVFNIVAGELISFTLEKIIKFLTKTLEKQLTKLESSSIRSGELKANIIRSILYIINSRLGEKVQEKFSDFLSDKIKVSISFGEMLKNSVDMKQLVKISLLLLLCLTTFIMNFGNREDAIEHAKEDSQILEDSFKVEEDGKKIDRRDEEKVTKAIKDLKEKNEEIEKEETLVDTVTNADLLKKKQMEKYIEDNFDEKKYEMSMFNPLDHVKRIVDYIDEGLKNYEDLSNGIAVFKSVVKKGNPGKKLQKLRYYGVKDFFMQQMNIYVTNKLPSILEVAGYHIGRNRQDIYFKAKHKWSLESYMKKPSNKKIGSTHRLIIAYGVARAMELLHEQNIVHRNLKPAVILLDDRFHPYVSEFYYARRIDADNKYVLTETSAEFMSPEFIADYKSNQNSFKIDVYAFGITILWLLMRTNPFGKSCKPEEILEDTVNGKRPEIPEKVEDNWKELIRSCWSQDPNCRPTFGEIRKLLESPAFVNESIKEKIFKKYMSLFKEPKEKIPVSNVKVLQK